MNELSGSMNARPEARPLSPEYVLLTLGLTWLLLQNRCSNLYRRLGPQFAYLGAVGRVHRMLLVGVHGLVVVLVEVVVAVEAAVDVLVRVEGLVCVLVELVVGLVVEAAMDVLFLTGVPEEIELSSVEGSVLGVELVLLEPIVVGFVEVNVVEDCNVVLDEEFVNDGDAVEFTVVVAAELTVDDILPFIVVRDVLRVKVIEPAKALKNAATSH